MLTNLRNCVRNLRFKNESRLTPLFEAISNSLHAITERGQDRGRIRVQIERTPQKAMPTPVGQAFSSIDSITVIDTGEGFTERNFKAFDELDTGNKLQLGSKGIGRLFWLKVFEEVLIESVFLEDGQTFKRVFSFGLPDGIRDHKKQVCTEKTPLETSIKLRGVRGDYARAYRLEGETLAQAILEHFLSFFTLQFVPDIVIEEGGNVVASIGPSSLPPIKDDPFKINGVPFRLIHMKLAHENASTHTVNFCASDRVVKSKSLVDLLGNFTRKPLEEEYRFYYYAGYVLSEELTHNVSAERDEFQIERRAEDLFGHNKVSMQEIEQEVASRVQLFLQAPLEALCQARDARLESVFSQKVPELAYLRRLDVEELQNVSFDARENDIALTANRVHFEKRRNVVARLDHTLDHLEAQNLGDFESFRSTFAEQIKTLSEVSQADLSAYMLYRQRVLAIMLKLVKFSDDGSGFEKEKAIHSLFFPRFQDSEGAQIYNGHNLWLLDEALSYEGYIASDVRLSEHKLLISDSDSRPDIAAYGIQFATSVPTRPFDHITIIEMKRPGRKMEKNLNPIQQIYNYIDDIRNGKIRDFNGLEIKTNDQTRFTGIVLCDTMSDKVRNAARREKLIPEADGLSYHGSNPEYNLYIRIVAFRQVYEKACLRLKSFFDRLGLQEN